MLATIMSTLGSYTFIAGVTFGNDIVGRLRSFTSDEERGRAVQRWTKVGIVLAGTIAVSLALTMPSVVKLWYAIGTCIIPGLLVPVLASYFPRLMISPAFAFSAMCGGFLGSSLWLFSGYMIGGVSLYGIEPMYPGLLVSVCVWGAGKITER
jgi:SSS family solute:Na+ symporter